MPKTFQQKPRRWTQTLPQLHSLCRQWNWENKNMPFSYIYIYIYIYVCISLLSPPDSQNPCMLTISVLAPNLFTRYSHIKTTLYNGNLNSALFSTSHADSLKRYGSDQLRSDQLHPGPGVYSHGLHRSKGIEDASLCDFLVHLPLHCCRQLGSDPSH